MIPYGRQDITDADITAVVEVLTSDFLTQGPVVPAFEQAVAKVAQAPYAVAMNSATSALHVACAALGLGPGDSLWTSPISFVASANCALYCGARVDFVDIDPLTGNLCPKALAQKLAKAEDEGNLPKILVPVHLTGLPCDMKPIWELAKTYDIRVIEDASHAIGATYYGQPVGNGAYSDITVFSFHPVKIVTSGEGGVAVTNSDKLAAQMARLRSHGITRDADLMTHAPDGPWYYQQIELGWNYRLTDIQAALGLSQIKRVQEYVTKRNELAKRYDQAFSAISLTPAMRSENTLSAFHLYVIQVDPEQHLRIFTGLRDRGIGVNLHYIPIHLQPYYQQFGFAKGDFPNAETYYSRAISIPMFPTMTHDQQDHVIAAVADLV